MTKPTQGNFYDGDRPEISNGDAENGFLLTVV